MQRLWEISQQSLRLIKERTDFLRREKSSQVAALSESGLATWDILSLKQGSKESGRYLGGVSGGSSSTRCPPKGKIMSGSCLGGV